MQSENSNQPVLEKQLFHGTNQCVVDGICKSGFDWRRCGVHGTMYGQGKLATISPVKVEMCTLINQY